MSGRPLLTVVVIGIGAGAACTTSKPPEGTGAELLARRPVIVLGRGGVRVVASVGQQVVAAAARGTGTPAIVVGVPC